MDASLSVAQSFFDLFDGVLLIDSNSTGGQKLVSKH